MKKMLGCTLVLSLMLVLLVPGAQATGQAPSAWDQLLNQTLEAVEQLSNEPTTLKVSGTSTVSVAPDRAVINIGVSAQNQEVEAAQTEANEKVQAILDALLGLQIQQENIMTSQYRVNPVYDYSGDTPVLTGYEVSNQLTVLINNFDLVNIVIDTAVKAGANQMNGLNFEVSQRGVYYQQVLQGAFADGQAKATVLATASGKTLGNLVSIEESSSVGGGGYPVAYMAMDSGAGATNIQAGLVEIGASVTLVFELR